MMRVFVGIELSEEMRHACVQTMQALECAVQGKWTLESNLHLTLAFIGEAEAAQLPVIEEILREATKRFAPPRLALSQPGVFAKKRNAILYAGVKSDVPLAPMHDFLITALQSAGLPADPGPFTPHVTLARKAEIQGEIPASPLKEAAFTPAYLTLFESARDEKEVLRYMPIRRCVWG